jgi:hypothetical protein
MPALTVFGSCRDCRFWASLEECIDPGLRPDERLRPQVKGNQLGLGLCRLASRPHVPHTEPMPEPDPRVLCEDASSYTANLRTRADFGCVGWRSKEVQTP